MTNQRFPCGSNWRAVVEARLGVVASYSVASSPADVTCASEGPFSSAEMPNVGAPSGPIATELLWTNRGKVAVQALLITGAPEFAAALATGRTL